MVESLDPVVALVADSQGNTANISRGYVLNAPISGAKTTYSFSSTPISTPASATDIFTIQAGSKIVRVLRVEVSANSGVGGANSHLPVILAKRPVLDTGGTSTTFTGLTGVDSSDPLSTATITQYSANPTIPGFPFFMRAAIIYLAPIVPHGGQVTRRTPGIVWSFGNNPGSGIVVRSQELLAVNLNGGTGTGANFFVDIEWTEE